MSRHWSSLPILTQRLHGRATSQARCARLHRSHARETLALAPVGSIAGGATRPCSLRIVFPMGHSKTKSLEGRWSWACMGDGWGGIAKMVKRDAHDTSLIVGEKPY